MNSYKATINKMCEWAPNPAKTKEFLAWAEAVGDIVSTAFNKDYDDVCDDFQEMMFLLETDE